MNTGMAIPGSALTAAAFTFIFDPVSGGRRRALLRDQLFRRYRKTTHFLDIARRDLAHRAQGLYAEARYRIRGREASDDLLVLRVAAKVGRYVSHPKAIGVTAEDGRVTLHGLILSHEVSRALRGISAVPGVKEVLNELTPHDEPGNIPDLQGGHPRGGHRIDVLHDNWAPSTRLIMGSLGTAMAIDGLRRPAAVGIAELVFGALLLARCSVNRPVRRLIQQRATAAQPERERKTVGSH